MKDDYKDVKQQVAELAKQRDRSGKQPLSKEERISLLQEIYDGLLYLWKQCVITGTAKSTNSIHFQLSNARSEMMELQRSYDLIDARKPKDAEHSSLGWADVDNTPAA